MKKRIIFYSKAFYTGGMENAVYHLIRLLNKTDKYDITVCFYESNEKTEKMLNKLASVAKIECVVGKRFGCGVLINCDREELWLPFIQRDKTIHWFHSCIIDPKAQYDFNERYMNIAVVSQSKWHKEKLDALGIDSVTIGNPLDVDYIIQQSNEWISPDFTGKTVYVMLCRLSREKGLERAMSMMRGHLRDNSLLVIVGGSQSPYGDRIKIDMESTLGKSVLFVGEKDNPYPYIRKAKYVMCLSDHEIYGLVSEESHILGKPVIFNHYETASDQFIKGFDSWINESITVPDKQYDFADVRRMVNTVRFEKWEALINE